MSGGLQLLGASLWHSPDLIKSGVEFFEGAVFVDGFFVNGYLPETNDFVDVYYAEYGREPGNIDALVYDTMDIVLQILDKHKIKTRMNSLRLCWMSVFPGSDRHCFFQR